MKGTRNHQQGQALTEFLVLAVALIPLLLLMPIIAKYQDISHATQMASRYVAFDATTRNAAMSAWKPESQLADEVRRRFFSNTEAAIKTYDVAGDFRADQNPFWRGPAGRPLIERFSDVSVSFGRGAGLTHSAGLSASSDGHLFALRSLASLNTSGIYTADVSVRLLKLPAGIESLEPFDNIDLSITCSTSVIFEPWAASSARQTQERVRGIAAVADVLGESQVSTALGIGIQAVDFSLPHLPSPTLRGRVVPPQFGNLEPWRDVVPGDRLRDKQ